MGRGRKHAADCSPRLRDQRPRGRPPIQWTESRKRKLLRLYLGMPASVLSLRDIRRLLTEGKFQPAERKTQEILRKLLSDGYHKRRPANRAAETERLAFFRSIRQSWQESPGEGSSQPNGLSTVAVYDQQESSGGVVQHASHSVATSSDFLPVFYNDGYGLVEPEPAPPKRRPTERRFSFDGTHDSDFSASHDTDRFERRKKRLSSLRRKLSGSRSSSILERIASLLSSNLSLRSTTSHGLQHMMSRSTLSSVDSSEISPNIRATNPREQPNGPRSGERATPTRQSVPSSSTIPDEELAVIQACCSMSSSTSQATCVHQRLKKVVRASGSSLSISSEEATAKDRLGNTLLHVAARWGASLALLQSLITQGAGLTATNNLGETFLHLVRPWCDLYLTPGSVARFITVISNRRFDFCSQDKMGHSFLEKWALSPAMTQDLFELFLSMLPQSAKRNVLSNQPIDVANTPSWVQHAANANHGGFPVSFRQLAGLASYDDQHYRDAIDSRYVVADRQNVRRMALPPRRGGWNHIHQLVAAAHLHYRAPDNSTSSSSPSNAEAEKQYLDALATALAEDPTGVDNRESGTNRTPLMTLINSWSWWKPVDRSTPFLLAVLGRLLRAGASLHLQDAGGYTPLHFAVATQLSEVVQLFCQSDANVNAETLNGTTPLELARQCIQQEMKRKGSAELSMVGLARLLECGTVLIDYGGKGSQGRDWKQWFDWGKYLDQEWQISH